MNCTAEVVTKDILNLSIDRLCAKQKKVMSCRSLAAQSHHKNKNTFNPVIISPDGLLQKQQYVHGLKHDVTTALNSIIPVILHEFQNSKRHQGTTGTFEAIRIFYWWTKLCQYIVNHTNKCKICG